MFPGRVGRAKNVNVPVFPQLINYPDISILTTVIGLFDFTDLLCDFIQCIDAAVRAVVGSLSHVVVQVHQVFHQRWSH